MLSVHCVIAEKYNGVVFVFGVFDVTQHSSEVAELAELISLNVCIGCDKGAELAVFFIKHRMRLGAVWLDTDENDSDK